MTRSFIRTLRRPAPVAAGLLSAVLLAAGPAAAAGTALHAVPSPSPAGAAGSDLVSVAAVSPADAWAVGTAFTGSPTFRGTPLAEHFNGTRWSIAATAPVPAGHDIRLAGAGFSSGSDGWAVGTDANLATGTGSSVIEHFNGTTWTRLPSPAGEPFRAGLASVTAISATDAWAVGSGGSTPLIEHWNGSTWSIVPGAVGSGRLYSITALSAGNIWAVGETGNRAVAPVIEHFDGTVWHQVAQPVNTYQSFLISVSAASPNDIWAVGGQTGGTPPVLLEHFNGTAWTEVPNPALPAGLGYEGWLRGVTAVGPGDVWAVGFRRNRLIEAPDPGPALRRHRLAGRSHRQPARRKRPARIRRRHQPRPAPVGNRTRPHHRNHHRLTAPSPHPELRRWRRRAPAPRAERRATATYRTDSARTGSIVQLSRASLTSNRQRVRSEPAPVVLVSAHLHPGFTGYPFLAVGTPAANMSCRATWTPSSTRTVSSTPSMRSACSRGNASTAIARYRPMAIQ